MELWREPAVIVKREVTKRDCAMYLDPWSAAAGELFSDKVVVLEPGATDVHVSSPREIGRLAEGFLPQLREVMAIAAERDRREEAQLLEDGRQGERWWRGWDG